MFLDINTKIDTVTDTMQDGGRHNGSQAVKPKDFKFPFN